MSLNASTTADDIIAALQAAGLTSIDSGLAKPYWVAVINALYTRIKADIQITSQVQVGIHVSVAGNATNQAGATDAIGTANSTVVN